MRLIDADALIISLAKDRSALVNNHVPYGELRRIDETIWKVAESPTISAVPVVRGEWGQCSAFDEDENVYTCSVCGEPWTLFDGTPQENNMHYCPNCGAKMEDKT